ncbi:SDR family NAD(P)-dependent oxidoreductase [Hoeflea sp. YIM 152468]|uniref:SDR family NAD(P)-dependent oxidoreductase n=1 Tax=Hoeflea sp. YIM 152468 TaxID=3031759 RepID=UPI0023DC3744|nr:SDR family NAD(P)-dependent oxidoreductase [Hoeflea sp. YIM 152468]MDF1608208.1 SDR family NAD(P)-dependent oxidoreductase [Hoeflea sp. YIM 152468]
MAELQSVMGKDKVAVVTGAASGIGLAAARIFADHGMCVVLVDNDRDKLAEAEKQVAAHSADPASDIVSIETDVSDLVAVEALERTVMERFGRVHLLMNNAGIQPGSSLFGPRANWDRVLGVNLIGVINGTRVFGPGMIAHGEPAMIINTGSKQGLTTPPGDPAYNVAKTGVKAFTEALEHELRTTAGCQVRAHLLIPGFVFTPLAARGRTEKPDAAWTPEQTADFMMKSLAKGDFYILCPDNDVDRATDEKRVAWAAGDIIENRPPLSRWHPDYAEKFKQHLES